MRPEGSYTVVSFSVECSSNRWVVRPQGGARVRTTEARCSGTTLPGGIALPRAVGLRGGACGPGRSRCRNGGAGEGPRGFPEAQLPVPGCPLRPLAGPREPGAGEVLLPHGEDHRPAARPAAGPLGEEDGLPGLLLAPAPGPDLHAAPETGQRWTVQTCLTCRRSQRFLNDPGHVLWGDRPEAQLGSQADSKPPQSPPNTAHLAEEQVQPQLQRPVMDSPCLAYE